MVCDECKELEKIKGSVTAIFFNEPDAKKFIEKEKDFTWNIKKINILGIGFFAVSNEGL